MASLLGSVGPARARSDEWSGELGEELLHAAQSFRELGRLAGVRDADRARLAERTAGNDGDALRLEQRVAEVDVVRDLHRAVRLAVCARYVGERVERTARHGAAHTRDRVEGSDHLVALLL